MKKNLSNFGYIALLLGSTALAGIQHASAQTNVYGGTISIGYQGILKEDDTCGTGWRQIIWRVFPHPIDPDNPWPTNCPICGEFKTNSIYVNNGLFTTTLDVPMETLANSAEAYLQIGVRTDASANFTPLLPMQRMTAAPFAGVAQTVVGSIPASSLTGTMPTGMLTGIFSSPLNLNNPGNVFVGEGSQLANINAATLGGFTACNLPCYWKLTGNAGTDPNVNFIGTTDGAALTIRVANTPALRINRSHGAEFSPNIIGGDPANFIEPSVHASVIGGGGEAASPNAIFGPGSVIAGGVGNHIEDQMNVIGGGQGNSIDRSGGMPDPLLSVIGGGWSNTVSGAWSTIGGGGINKIVLSTQGESATIAGGYANKANGHMAAIGGGAGNTAGRASFVGGGWGNMATGNGSVVTGGTNNVASATGGVVGGGTHNQAQQPYSAIAGGSGNTVNGSYGFVGGGQVNAISGGAGSVICGGGGIGLDYPFPMLGNCILNDHSAIVGGLANVIRGRECFIGGGWANYIDDLSLTNTHCATISGGTNNYLNADFGSIGGGINNRVSGTGATVAGGQANMAFGSAATIPGGTDNLASGFASFAAGNRAKAFNNGAFVWSDSQNTDFSSTADNQFAVRAQNGVMIQGTTTTLDLRGNGAIRVAGAGVATPGPVFIQRATSLNTSGHITTIDNPLCNGDPNAILIVTHNFTADTSSTPYEPNAVGVWYNGSRWTIYHENTGVAMPIGRAFNVMVIKP